MNPTVSDSSTLRLEGNVDAADCGIERGKHARRFQHLGLRERVEQRRLARVGVSDQSYGRHRRGLAPLPLLGANAAHIFDLLLSRGGRAA